MKRILAALLLLSMLLSALVPVLAAPDYDYDGEVLKSLGVLTGDEDGDLMLNNNLRRQDMVVMISRLYKEEDKAKSYVGRNVFKDLNADRKFYIPYITWAKESELIQGQELDVFGFNSDTTVQEFQTVLLRALGYGEESQNWNQVPEVAKSLGIMDNLNLNPSSKLTRGQMATMVLNTLKQNKKGNIFQTLAEVIGLDIPELFKVDEKLTINKNTITLAGKAIGVESLNLHIRPTTEGITGGAILRAVDLDKDGEFEIELKDLQAGNYEYRFEGSSKNTVFKSFSIKEVDFALVDITADNLKEITLTFTQPVDTASSAFISNYTSNAGSISGVRFADNNKKVMLTLNSTMKQAIKYEISGRVIGEDGQELILEKEEFTASDKSAPHALEVVQLGDKGLKVVFSEPIKGAASSNFIINDRTFNGNVNIVNDEVFLIFASRSNYLREGSHTITINGVVDFANHRVSNEYLDFEIIDDDTPPEIVGARASLEEVIIEFNEDIDPDTANRNQFYMIGSRNRKINPDSVSFVGNKAYLSFKNNRLSYSYETTIYVENVMDYSGNRMKLDEIDVLPIIDENPPMVTNTIVAEDGRSIEVHYSKDVNGKNRSDYEVEDQSGRTLNIRDIQGSAKVYTIYLSTALPIGENTLYIEGVEDTTPLKNLMVPYSTTIDMKDITRPDVLGYTGYGNFITVQFNKEMDYRTVENKENYIINFNGSLIYLPLDSYIDLSDDGKTLTIELPDRISGKDVVIGDNLSLLELRGLKDISGNDLKDLIKKLEFDRSSSGKAKAVDYYASVPGKQGVLVDEDTIKIRFNIPIVAASVRDFNLTGRTIEDVYVDDRSNEVTLYLRPSDSTSVADGDLSIVRNNYMETIIGTGVESGDIHLVDEVAPRVLYPLNSLKVTSDRTTEQIELPFTEELEAEAVSLYRRDLEIYREEDGRLLSRDDYTTSLKRDDKRVLLIEITDTKISSHYTIRVVGEFRTEPSYIRDLQGNLALDSLTSYTTEKKVK